MRQSRIVAAVAACLMTTLLVTDGRACSTFCLRDGERVVFGKNYDWMTGDGLLIVNKRNVARTADGSGNGQPASWIARYGSVTFNQFGRDFPNGGMNEAGLVVELMWLDETSYPAPDRRPTVDNLQWIQYQLDNHATVEEVIASDREVRIAARAPLHYLVADRQGGVATIEFLDGRLVAHTGKTLPVAALTNSPYGDSLRYLDTRSGSQKKGVYGTGSLDRFAGAATRVGGWSSEAAPDAVAYAFETLEQVAQGRSTQWSIVYEIDRGKVHFRTLDRPAVRSLDLADLDFSCATPVRMLELDAAKSGDVQASLAPYAAETNLALIRSSFRKVDFLADVPESELARIAEIPDAAICRD